MPQAGRAAKVAGVRSLRLVSRLSAIDKVQERPRDRPPGASLLVAPWSMLRVAAREAIGKADGCAFHCMLSRLEVDR
jgi:hypothetical protein